MRVALIPARGGSKGIPRKNIRELAGKPLIVWTIEAALAAPGIDRVVVSTEDSAIAIVARDAGADVPFMRPADLASDTAPGIAPVMHALDMLPDCEEIVLLQPTSPLRTADTIGRFLAFAQSADAPSVVSVCEAEKHPALMYHRSQEGRLSAFASGDHFTRRQDLPPLYLLNGAIYLARDEWVRRTGKLVDENTLGFVMDSEESVDIDTMLDWRFAELLLSDRA